MLLLLSTLVIIGCGKDPLDEFQEKKKEPMSCEDACKAYHKDARSGPKFIKFHYEKAGSKAFDRCFEQAIVMGKSPVPKCDKEAVEKCSDSCRVMRDKENKKSGGN